MLPVYMMIAGAVFALALRNTSGSILSPLAALTPWVLGFAGVLAMIATAGAVLRWRRRLIAVRRGRASHSGRQTGGVSQWQDASGAQPAARP